MVEALHLEQIHDRAGAAGLRVHGADHAAVNPGLNDRAAAHLTGFQCDVDGAALQPPVLKLPGGFPDRIEFGMGKCVVIGVSPIISSGNHLALFDNDTADRDLPQRLCTAGLLQCQPHIVFICFSLPDGTLFFLLLAQLPSRDSGCDLAHRQSSCLLIPVSTFLPSAIEMSFQRVGPDSCVICISVIPHANWSEKRRLIAKIHAAVHTRG